MSNARSLASLLTNGKLYGAKLMAPSDLPVLTVTAADTASVSAGVTTVTGALSTNSTTDVVALTITVDKFTGTLRFKASHYNDNFATSSLSVFKNGSLVQTYTTTNSIAQARSNDIAVVPGDIIVWKHKVSNGSTNSVIPTSSITASDSYVLAQTYKKNSE